MKATAILIGAALVALAGCATAPAQPRMTSNDDPSTACYEAIPTDSRFDAFYAKTPRRVADMTLEMTTDPSRASDDEKRVLGVLAVARQTCQEMGDSFRAAYAPPGWNDETRRFHGRYMDLLSDLYSGKATWGDFNKQRRQLSNETQATLQAIDQHQQETAMQQDAAARQAAMSNYLLLRSLQPVLVQPRPAVRAPLNCTTRYIGGTAYTSCQ